MHVPKFSHLAWRAVLPWITFSPECCSVKCLYYAANLKESKLDNCRNCQCSFYTFELASLVSAEPVTMGPCWILFFSGSRIILSHVRFCSHIKCTVIPCTESFFNENICVALYYLGGGREGMRNYSTCNTQIVVLPAGPLFQCFNLLISSESKTFPFALI